MYYIPVAQSLGLGVLLTLGSVGIAFFVQWLVRDVPMLESEDKNKKRPSATRMSTLRCASHYVMIYAGVVVMLMAIPWDLERLFPVSVSNVVHDTLLALKMLILIDLIFYLYHRASHLIGPMFRHSHFEHHLETNPRSVRDSTLAHWTDWIMTILLDIWPLVVFPQTLLSFAVLATWLPAQAQFNHCGRRTPKMPFVMSSAQHYAHHRHNKVNFSEHTTIFDSLFGTLMVHDTVLAHIDHSHGMKPPMLVSPRTAFLAEAKALLPQRQSAGPKRS